MSPIPVAFIVLVLRSLPCSLTRRAQFLAPSDTHIYQQTLGRSNALASHHGSPEEILRARSTSSVGCLSRSSAPVASLCRKKLFCIGRALPS
ncbi:hypothetical protein OH77DRAFT_257389 [Trametes cingulata]|nr:hypothetical protein OH77DRAFT_257389 [Trametes cingulata]